MPFVVNNRLHLNHSHLNHSHLRMRTTDVNNWRDPFAPEPFASEDANYNVLHVLHVLMLLITNLYLSILMSHRLLHNYGSLNKDRHLLNLPDRLAPDFDGYSSTSAATFCPSR